MRAVEEKWLRDAEARRRRDIEARLERHRLDYVYYLNRLVEALSLTTDEQEPIETEIREIARLCRRERAAYVRMTEAEADRTYGSVIDVAGSLVRMETEGIPT